MMDDTRTKGRRILICALMALVVLLGVFGCTDKVVNITVEPATLTMTAGETQTLTATVTNTQEAVVWTSSDENIATVTGSGDQNKTAAVTGVASGTVTIFAEIDDVIARCTVTVNQAPDVEVTDLTVKYDGNITPLLYYTQVLEFDKFSASSTAYPGFTKSDFAYIIKKAGGAEEPLTADYSFDTAGVHTVKATLNKAGYIGNGTLDITVNYETAVSDITISYIGDNEAFPDFLTGSYISVEDFAADSVTYPDLDYRFTVQSATGVETDLTSAQYQLTANEIHTVTAYVDTLGYLTGTAGQNNSLNLTVRSIGELSTIFDYQLISSCDNLGDITAVVPALNNNNGDLTMAIPLDYSLTNGSYNFPYVGMNYVFESAPGVVIPNSQPFGKVAVSDNSMIAATVTDNVITVEGSIVRDLGLGDYTLRIELDNIYLDVHFSVVTKVLQSAEDIKYMRQYAGISLSTTASAPPYYHRNTYYRGYFSLGSSIDASTVSPNSNMLVGDHNFGGILDGRGYTIDGGKWEANGGAGLFANNYYAEIKNIAFTNVILKGGTASTKAGPSLFGNVYSSKFTNVLVDILSAQNLHYRGAVAGYVQGDMYFENCVFYIGTISNTVDGIEYYSAFSRSGESISSSGPVIAAKNVYVYCTLANAYWNNAANVERYADFAWLNYNSTLNDKGRKATLANPNGTWAAGTLPSVKNNPVFDSAMWNLNNASGKARFVDKV